MHTAPTSTIYTPKAAIPRSESDHKKLVETRKDIATLWSSVKADATPAERQAQLRALFQHDTFAQSDLPEYIQYDIRAFLLAKTPLEFAHAAEALEKAVVCACAWLDTRGASTRPLLNEVNKSGKAKNPPSLVRLTEEKRFCIAIGSVVTGKPVEAIHAEISKYECACCSEQFADLKNLRAHAMQTRYPADRPPHTVPYSLRSQLGPVAAQTCFSVWASRPGNFVTQGNQTLVQCPGCEKMITRGTKNTFWLQHLNVCTIASGTCVARTLEKIAGKPHTHAKCTKCGEAPTDTRAQTVNITLCPDCGEGMSFGGNAYKTHADSGIIHFGHHERTAILGSHGVSYDETTRQYCMKSTCLERLTYRMKLERDPNFRPPSKAPKGRIMPVSKNFIRLAPENGGKLINELVKPEFENDLVTIILSVGPRRTAEGLQALQQWLHARRAQMPAGDFWQEYNVDPIGKWIDPVVAGSSRV